MLSMLLGILYIFFGEQVHTSSDPRLTTEVLVQSHVYHAAGAQGDNNRIDFTGK